MSEKLQEENDEIVNEEAKSANEDIAGENVINAEPEKAEGPE